MHYFFSLFLESLLSCLKLEKISCDQWRTNDWRYITWQEQENGKFFSFSLLLLIYFLCYHVCQRVKGYFIFCYDYATQYGLLSMVLNHIPIYHTNFYIKKRFCFLKLFSLPRIRRFSKFLRLSWLLVGSWYGICEPPYLRSQMAKKTKVLHKAQKILGKNAIKNFFQNFSHFLKIRLWIVNKVAKVCRLSTNHLNF